MEEDTSSSFIAARKHHLKCNAVIVSKLISIFALNLKYPNKFVMQVVSAALYVTNGMRQNLSNVYIDT